MTEKIRLEIDNATDPGAQGAVQNLEKVESAADDLAAKAKKAEDAFNELVDAEIAAGKAAQQTGGQVRAQSQAMRDYYTVTKDAARANADFKRSANETGETLDKLKSAADGNVTSLIKLLGQFKAVAVPVGLAVAGFQVLTTVLASTGKSADGAENNLTKLNKALGLGGMSKAIVDTKDLDTAVTQLADGFVNLLDKVKAVASGIPIAMAESSKAIDAAQKSQKEFGDAFKKVTADEVESARKAAAEEKLRATHSIALIDDRMKHIKNNEDIARVAGKSDATRTRKALEETQALAKRRIEIEKEQTDATKKWVELKKQFEVSAEEEKKAKAQKVADDKKAAAEKSIQDEADAIEAGNAKIIEARQKAAEEEKKIREKAKEDAIRIEKEKQDAVKAQLEGQGVTGAGILQQQDPRKVFENLKRQRREQAETEFRRETRDQVDQMDPASRARNEAGARRAGREAEQQAFREFRTGQVNPADLAQAQGQAAQQQISALQQSGQLNGQTVQAVMGLVNAAQENQAATQALQQQVQQIQRQAGVLNESARNVRQSAQRGGTGK